MSDIPAYAPQMPIDVSTTPDPPDNLPELLCGGVLKAFVRHSGASHDTISKLLGIERYVISRIQTHPQVVRFTPEAALKVWEHLHVVAKAKGPSNWARLRTAVAIATQTHSGI